MNPPWLDIAYSLKGVTEIKGTQHNPAIIRMWEAIKAPFRDDETAWCAAYVGACLERAGLPSTRSAAARSYLKWGQKITVPRLGCVVVFWRGNPNGWSGHVGFVVGKTADGQLVVLGGNQGDSVSIKTFPRDRVLGYFVPKEYKGIYDALPTMNATATTGEA